MKYKYTAINQKNQKKTGFVEAATENEALNSLRNKGLVVQELSEASNSDAPTSILQMEIGGGYHKQKKIKPKKILMFLN